MRHGWITGLVAALAISCEGSQDAPTRADTAASTSAGARETSVAVATLSAASTPSGIGAAPAGASRAQREEAALSLLAGGDPAATLPVVPTDGDKPLDRTMRDRVAPRGSLSGRLPPEVIQRVVRQNFGSFRNCYDAGLKVNPSLQGRVSVRFVIGRDGNVAQAVNGGSDLPDKNAIDCIVKAFLRLSFPPPDGGVVQVTYPIAFTPGG